MVGRGPHRICTPPKMGLEEMAVLGTMSSTESLPGTAAAEEGTGAHVGCEVRKMVV